MATQMQNTQVKRSENLVEVIPGFFYPKARRLNKFQLILRRLKQVLCILFHPDYKNYDTLMSSVKKRFNTKTEVNYYVEMAPFGLTQDEKITFNEAHLKISKEKLKVLIIGCGGGREVMALADMGHDVLGIDIATDMIEEAKRKYPKLKLENCELHELSEKFDLIWISHTIDCHLQGEANRIRFYQECKERLNDNAVIIASPEIEKFHLLAGQTIVSHFLRLRWLFSSTKWEVGDTMESHLGIHNDSSYLVFYHYYQSEQEYKNVLSLAGFKAAKVQDSKLGHFLVY